MSAALAAARQGDRHTHAASVNDRDAGALLSVAAGALVAAAGSGGVTTAAVGAGVASGGGGQISTRDVIPYDTSGAVATGSPRTLLGAGGVAAALAGAEPVACRRHRDGPIRTGSASVFVDGMRLARATDETSCGAILCDGEKTVLVGGAPADGAPPDPLAQIAAGAALASVAVGSAVAVGMDAVETAMRWGEAIAGQAVSAVEKGEAQIESAAGAIAAQAGALLGGAREGIGAVMGLVVGGAR